MQLASRRLSTYELQVESGMTRHDNIMNLLKEITEELLEIVHRVAQADANIALIGRTLSAPSQTDITVIRPVVTQLDVCLGRSWPRSWV
jgi:hypothetical protein